MKKLTAVDVRRSNLDAMATVGGLLLSVRLLLEQKPATADDWEYVIGDVEKMLKAAQDAANTCAIYAEGE